MRVDAQITKSMKMIATTKLAKAQRAMNQAKAYGEANKVIFKESEANESESGEADPAKTLYIVVSSDRGLCGGIHSSVSKKTRAELQNSSSSPVRPLPPSPSCLTALLTRRAGHRLRRQAQTAAPTCGPQEPRPDLQGDRPADPDL